MGCGGFTLLEVIVAATVLSLASFGIFGSLAVMERLSFQAVARESAGRMFQARLQLLESMPFHSYRELASMKPPSASNTWRFQYGEIPGVPNTIGGPWLFYLPKDSSVSPDVNELRHLMSSKPSAGGAGLFPFFERVEISFPTAPSNSNKVMVQYTLEWLDNSYSENGSFHNYTFSFEKLDPSYYGY